MREKFKRYSGIIIPDAFVYLICLLGIYQIYLKAGLPVNLSFSNSGIIIEYTADNFYKDISGKKVISVDGYNFNSHEELEIYLDGKNIGDNVKLTISQDGTNSDSIVKLTNYYSNLYITIVLLVCSLFFIVAVFILLNAQEKKQAKYYHAVNITTAALMMTTWGNYIFDPYGAGIIIRIIFHLTSSFAPALFMHFIFVFPRDREEKNKRTLYSLYTISAVIFFLLNYTFIKAINDQTIKAFDNYVQTTNLFRLYIVILVILGIYLFIKYYINSDSLAEKKKIKWLLFGFLIGPGSYILLWVLPQIFTTTSYLPEEFIIIFMAAVPLTFGISIYRYSILDIDFIFNRSTVYGIILVFIIILYIIIAGSFSIIAGMLSFPESIYISSIVALLIGLIFHPLKNKVQKFVDKKFFRINYNFKTAHKLLIEEIKQSFTIAILAGKMKEKINEILQLENMLVYLPYPEINSLISERTDLNIKIQNILSDISSSKVILADSNYLEGDITFAQIDENDFGFKLIIPVTISAGRSGFIALGKKKSSIRFNNDDIDFLKDIAFQAALAIERINLQKEILIKQEESEKLKELNEMKSLFVSNVSHELKTPLTSIKMFVQLLQATDMPAERKNEYLKIIEKEGDRLTRLIDNILDYSKIEKGIMEYMFKKIDLNNILRETLDLMKFQLDMYKFEIQVSYWEKECLIYADRDAVEEALINLLTNAIKYSANSKLIIIKTFSDNGFACVNIQDKGIGIPEEDIKKIFEPFIRSNNFEKEKISGTGIGLSIIKHIMDSHNGQIKIKSEQNKGSCFTLLFPLLKEV